MNSTLKLDKEAKIWLKLNGGKQEILSVVPDIVDDSNAGRYTIYPAYEKQTYNLGRILFDNEGYWMYDGNELLIDEQEQVAKFIINYVETF